MAFHFKKYKINFILFLSFQMFFAVVDVLKSAENFFYFQKYFATVIFNTNNRELMHGIIGARKVGGKG